MSTLTKMEAQHRIEDAKNILEFVIQARLHDVGERLCRITHCPEYDEVSKIYDRVKALWYKLDSRAQSSKIDLDSEGASRFLAQRLLNKKSGLGS